jgi:uncharacterized membrane protein
MEKTQLIQRVRAYRLNLDWFRLFFAFLVCAFLGWVFETTVVWRETGMFTNRGYLTVLDTLGRYFPALQSAPPIGNLPVVLGLPIIEMYGFGGVFVLATLHNMRHHPVIVFCYGFVLLTLFELASSYFCGYVLHHEYWNYSSDLLNFQGRICLRSSIAWGILSVVSTEVLDPFIDELYDFERRRKYFKAIMTLLIIYAVICSALKYWLDPGLFPG